MEDFDYKFSPGAAGNGVLTEDLTAQFDSLLHSLHRRISREDSWDLVERVFFMANPYSTSDNMVVSHHRRSLVASSI